MSTKKLQVVGMNNNIADFIYPIGSIYMSVNNVDPSVLFGGLWERIKDMFLLAAGDNYIAGSTGGEATHKLTINEIPSHAHNHQDTIAWPLVDDPEREWGVHYYTAANQTHPYTQWINTTYSIGGGASHNNMPPYLAVNMWKRVE